MPRRRAEPIIPTNSLVASAVRFTGNSPRVFYKGNKGWQDEAWRHYDICGELRYAANWIGSVLSRATLHADKMKDEVATQQVSGKAVNAIRLLFNGPDGQSQMLNSLGIHLTVVGEAYLVGRTIGGADTWEVVGTREIKVNGANWSIDYGDGQAPIQLKDSDAVIRIWRPHPARRIEADSPVRALLPILTEIEYLTRHIFAQTSSRLAGAGILFLPQSMTFPAPPDIDGASAPANSADSFMLTLADAMLTPIKDPGNAAATVPIVVTVPDATTAMPQLMHFWTELDQHAVELRGEAIRRFAFGMDIPPEVILGMARAGSAANHWVAWQIEESAIKAHIEPLLGLICNGLTIGYLRPATDDPNDRVGYDVTDLKLRPDRSKEAVELYDRGELDGQALRRETGFDEDDLPTDEERKIWLLRKVASGSANTDQVQAALEQLGVKLDVPMSGGPQRDGRPAPSLVGHPPPKGPPDTQNDIPADNNPDAINAPVHSLLPAYEALVFRALERAGNRLRAANGNRKFNGTPADKTYLYVGQLSSKEIDHLLEDAWSCVGKIGLDDPLKVTAVLDSYCHDLLAQQTPHSRDALARYLDQRTA